MNKTLFVAIVGVLMTPFLAAAQSPSPSPSPGALPTPVPATFTQAVAVLNALPSTATSADKLAAVNAVLAAPDLPADQNAHYLHTQGYALLFAGHPATEYAPVFLASYNMGYHPAFIAYLISAIAAGDPIKSVAISQVPAYAAQPYAGVSGIEAMAFAAEQSSTPDAAIPLWNNVISASPEWNDLRGTAIVHIGNISKKRGDAPRQTDLILIPLLTSVNVPVADGNFQAAYRMVNRSTVSINGSTPILSPTELKTFLQGVLNCVALEDANQKFLTTVQSQLAAAN